MLRENRDFEVLKLSLIKSLQVPLFLKISICTNSRYRQADNAFIEWIPFFSIFVIWINMKY